MKVIVQPDAGVTPVLSAIKQAKKSIDILIFRLNRGDVASALKAAVARGVSVRALTAHTSNGGEKHLRRLELELLEAGVTVSRTADDLIRYHGKMLIVDGRVLQVYGFNFTTEDLTKSRSFGLVTRNARLVAEAVRLFSADFDRQPYLPRHERLIVSPENARERLAAFIGGARRQLLIYDPRASDDQMLQLLTDRFNAGVDVRILGKVESKWELPWQKPQGRRLHVRAIIRDGRRAFIGSQSLRRLELDHRREVGLIVNDRRAVEQLQVVFERDWALTPAARKGRKRVQKEKSEPAPSA